jgi:SAM-dependent methyltransferase
MTYDKKTSSEYAQLRQIHRPALAALIAGTAIQTDSRVLEVGCGTGNYISALQADTGCIAYGIDPSDEMLRKARSGGAQVTWICASAEKTGLADSRFDFVFTVDAIHHFGDRALAFQETDRLLSKGGVFVIVTDSEEIIRNRTPLSVYWPETIEIELARYPRTDTLETELRIAGFSDLRREEVRAVARLSDVTPYRAKVFSCLRLLSEDSYQRGLERLETDLTKGSIQSIHRYLLLWAKRAVSQRAHS